jgi:hypothetical protein
MGHRANFVVVDGDGWRLHYSHWAANGIYRRLAAGPDAALAFIRAQAACDPADGWLDDVWSEGGAVIDTVDRRLVWYGNDLMSELPSRRAYERVLAETWPGWRVEWAYDGIGDLAAHVGVDVRVVRNLGADRQNEPVRVAYELDELVVRDADPSDGSDDAAAELPANQQGTYQLVTVRTAGTVTAWALDSDREDHAAWLGPVLLDQLPGPGFDRLRLNAIPDSGLHVDVPARELGIWTGWICPGLLAEVGARWPDWTVTFWADRFERQLAAAGGVVTVPPVDERLALEWLAGSLRRSLTEPGTDPVKSFAGLIAREREEGKRVDVNPAAWRHQEVPPDEPDLALLWRALAKVAADLAARDRAAGPGGS